MVEIVHATSQDASQLVGLSKILGYDTDEASLINRINKITSLNNHCLLVAKNNDEVIGFCHGYIRTLVEVEDAVEIGGLVVKDAWQGKGIAKELVEGIEHWAKNNGFNMIVLSSNIRRVKAHGFYEHLGYKKIKQQFAFEKNI